MFYIAWLLTACVAALHAYILWLEMVEWEKPRTMRIFRTDAAFAAQTRKLAANMGLYNGFLAGGLALGLMTGGGRDLIYYLLACIVVAGLYGGVTVSLRIALVQAVPAALALLAWWAV